MSTPSERQRPPAHQPTLFELPAGPPAEAPSITETRGRPRLRTANREQIVFRAAPLDALLPQEHPARIVWAYVEGLDLTPLYDRIQAVVPAYESRLITPGTPTPDGPGQPH